MRSREAQAHQEVMELIEEVDGGRGWWHDQEFRWTAAEGNRSMSSTLVSPGRLDPLNWSPGRGTPPRLVPGPWDGLSWQRRAELRWDLPVDCGKQSWLERDWKVWEELGFIVGVPGDFIEQGEVGGSVTVAGTVGMRRCWRCSIRAWISSLHLPVGYKGWGRRSGGQWRPR
jgi:hypothetical protein